jgi:enoyl-CoA hydratase
MTEEMTYDTLLTTLEEGILTVTVNRPDKLNALNRSVLADLDKLMDSVLSNPDVKAVILTGAGPKAFVAGADISEFMEAGPDEGAALAKRGQDLFFRIENCPKPFIAAVNGFALGGGCELAMSCHFRLASDNAKFGQPEVNLGIIPGYGGTQRLPRLIGQGRAMELILSGNIIDAAEALRIGLVNHVTTPDTLLEKAKAILQTIISKSPVAVAQAITAVNASAAHDTDGYTVEMNMFSGCFGTEDMKEGVAAFLQKRKPSFPGH